MNTDPLTGAGSRSFFLECLASTIEQAQRAGERFGVFVFDIDSLACFMLQHGHMAGDDLLRRIGREVGALLEPAKAFSRIGGDKFALLVWGDALDQLPTIASGILGVISGLAVGPYKVLQYSQGSEPFDHTWTERDIVTATGVMMYHPQHFASPSDFLELFPEALVQAKRAGRGCWMQFKLDT